jgi:hypothetical protein
MVTTGEDVVRALMHGAIGLRLHAGEPGMDEQDLIEMASTLDEMRRWIESSMLGKVPAGRDREARDFHTRLMAMGGVPGRIWEE